MKCSLLTFSWHANFHTSVLLPHYFRDTLKSHRAGGMITASTTHCGF